MFSVLTADLVCDMWRPRPLDAHKGIMGHAFMVVGRIGVSGCAVLSAESCLRSGVGKLTLLTQEANRIILQLAVPEAVLQVSSSEEDGPWADGSRYEALGVGPGIGLDDEARRRLTRLLCWADKQSVPVVVDADALRLLKSVPGVSALLSGKVILTPHRGEMMALKHDFMPGAESLEEAARQMAATYGLTVILKGHPTLIFLPDGAVWSCPWGNPGMATAGSGDVLTGLLTGLLAQGYPVHHAALLGVSLHAMAGDEAADRLGWECMLARDIIASMPSAFAKVRNRSRKEYTSSLNIDRNNRNRL